MADGTADVASSVLDEGGGGAVDPSTLAYRGLDAADAGNFPSEIDNEPTDDAGDVDGAETLALEN